MAQLLVANTDGAQLPVKNTFIHFDEADAVDTPVSRGRRLLKRWQTDPNESKLLSRFASVQPSTGAASPLGPSSSTGGTPEGGADPSHSPPSPAAPSRTCDLSAALQQQNSRTFSLDLVLPSDASTDLSTPEHTPRPLWRKAWSASASSGCSTPPGPAAPPVAAAAAVASQPSRVPQCAWEVAPASGVLPPLGCGPTPPAAAAFPAAAASFAFNFTLRLADDVPLGVLPLPARTREGSPCIMVGDVLPHGALDAWNRQCVDSSAPSIMKLVRPGDLIVGVNGKSGIVDMWRECEEKELLKITVEHGALGSFCGLGGFGGPCSALVGFAGFPGCGLGPGLGLGLGPQAGACQWPGLGPDLRPGWPGPWPADCFPSCAADVGAHSGAEEPRGAYGPAAAQ